MGEAARLCFEFEGKRKGSQTAKTQKGKQTNPKRTGVKRLGRLHRGFGEPHEHRINGTNEKAADQTSAARLYFGGGRHEDGAEVDGDAVAIVEQRNDGKAERTQHAAAKAVQNGIPVGYLIIEILYFAQVYGAI